MVDGTDNVKVSRRKRWRMRDVVQLSLTLYISTPLKHWDGKTRVLLTLVIVSPLSSVTDFMPFKLVTILLPPSIFTTVYREERKGLAMEPIRLFPCMVAANNEPNVLLIATSLGLKGNL